MLLLAALMGLMSLATVRVYVHVVPLWAALAGLGTLLLAAALLARRWLDAGPSKERGGFTAEPLFGGGRAVRAVELAAATAVFAPPAQGPQAPGPDFRPGGGSAGGAGAGGEWRP